MGYFIVKIFYYTIDLYLVSDTDSGQGSSITTASTDSLKVSKSDQQDEIIENIQRRSLIKGLFNIGNTCFFNVIIQVCNQ